MKQMANSIKKYLNLYYYNNKLIFRSIAIYKVNFILDIVIDLISIFLSIFFYKILYLQIKNIGGWEIQELYLLVITVKIVNDLYSIFFRTNVSRIGEYIQSGKLDYLIILPVNLFFLLTILKMNIKGFFNLFVSIILFIIVYISYDFSFPYLNFIYYFLMIIYAVLIKFCFSFLISLLSFYFIKINALSHFFSSFFSLSTFPDSIFSNKIFKYIFIYIIPVIVIGNVPVKAILSGFSLSSFLNFSGLLIILLILSIKALKYTIKKYSSASS